MAARKNGATARIPVTPETLEQLRSTMSREETYDEVIRETVTDRKREKCVHQWGRRTAYRKVCRLCGISSQ